MDDDDDDDDCDDDFLEGVRFEEEEEGRAEAEEDFCCAPRIRWTCSLRFRSFSVWPDLAERCA